MRIHATHRAQEIAHGRERAGVSVTGGWLVSRPAGWHGKAKKASGSSHRRAGQRMTAAAYISRSGRVIKETNMLAGAAFPSSSSIHIPRPRLRSSRRGTYYIICGYIYISVPSTGAVRTCLCALAFPRTVVVHDMSHACISVDPSSYSRLVLCLCALAFPRTVARDVYQASCILILYTYGVCYIAVRTPVYRTVHPCMRRQI